MTIVSNPSGPSAPPVIPSGNSGNLAQAIANAAGSNVELTGILATNASLISSLTANMQEIFMQADLQEQQAAKDDLAKQEKEDAKHGIFHQIKSHAQIISKCTLLGVTLATGQYELTATIAASMVMKHYASDLSEGIAKTCQAIDPNMNDNVAAAIGDVVASAVIAVAVVGAGRFGAAFEESGAVATRVATTAAREAAEEGGVEMANLAEDAGSEAGAEVSELAEGSSVGQVSAQRVEQETSEAAEEKAKKTLSKQVKHIILSGLYGLAQGWNATGATTDILKATGNDSMKMDLIANSITEVLVIGISMGSTSGMSKGMSELKLANSEATLLKMSQFVRSLARVIEVVAGSAECGYTVKMAGTTKNLGKVQSGLDNSQYNLQMLSQENQMNIQAVSNQIKDCFAAVNQMYATLAKSIGSAAQNMRA